MLCRILYEILRKQNKDKKRSCALDYPHKRNWENRWTPKEQSKYKEDNKEIEDSKKI